MALRHNWTVRYGVRGGGLRETVGLSVGESRSHGWSQGAIASQKYEAPLGRGAIKKIILNAAYAEAVLVLFPQEA